MLAVMMSASAPQAPLTYDQGAIVRADTSKKQIALVFTGGDYGEGTAPILDTLQRERVPAGLFVTGGYLRAPGHAALLRRALREGHYVGPHSDQHLLYCAWEDRSHSLVGEPEFKRDLAKNIADLRALGALRRQPVFFIPPYEWFNHEQVLWAQAMQVVMFNFTPGSGSNRDYLPETDARFVSSASIVRDILAYERRDPAGLNGFILLLHLGADRRDKMHEHLGELIQELRARGYSFVRIDALLRAAR